LLLRQEIETKQRKSVAFSEGSVIMDTNGQVTDAPPAEKPAGTQQLPALDLSRPSSRPTNIHDADKEVDEVTDMFKGLSKKKKTKKSSKSADAEDGEAPAADGEFDPSAMKKKKSSKSKSKSKVDPDDFEAKLAEAGITEDTAEEQPEEIPEGDREAGTGIWQHDATQAIPYTLLISRFFSLIESHHPDLLSSGSKSYKIPPPQCLREGNRRTVFANIAEICKRMKRSEDHVTQFLFAELGTSGSVDGSRRLVIKGRFQQKGIESVLRRYIGMSSGSQSRLRSRANIYTVEYVTCKTCRSPDTELSKGENRLYFVTCNSCGSRRSVAAIKAGFRSQIGRRKRVG
jgi:translation initiation factor 2 subunit 2